MAQLVDGIWQETSSATKNAKGEFIRREAQFRNWITRDGSAGPSGDAGFVAESKRYHLYVSLACPWAHRTLIVRALKGLESHIGVTVVSPLMLEQGWEFSEGGEPLYGSRALHQLYSRAEATYSGRVSVPVLWDTKLETIVSNESSEIIRMFNSEFDDITGNTLDLWPLAMREEIEETNALVYAAINNGVYRCGFARTQEAYDEAYDLLFNALDILEERLSTQRYLLGVRPTEADIRLFTTLLRFDPVYFGHFKCNRQRLIDYPNLWNYMLEICAWPGVAETIDLQQIKTHYYRSHETINPTRIVPKGPRLDLQQPHDRERFKGMSLVQCADC